MHTILPGPPYFISSSGIFVHIFERSVSVLSPATSSSGHGTSPWLACQADSGVPDPSRIFRSASERSVSPSLRLVASCCDDVSAERSGKLPCEARARFMTTSPNTPLNGARCEWERPRALGAAPVMEPRPVGGRPSCSDALQLPPHDEVLAGGNCGGDIGVSGPLPTAGIGADRHASKRCRSFSRGFSA